jgi:uracil-xanthine permease
MNGNKMLIDVKERPKRLGYWMLLSMQHVFAMFGATILVPIITGLDVGVALFASGLGTLIYVFLTRAKVPVYLGSSFAYIPVISAAIASSGGVASAYVGLMAVGIVYALVAIVIRFIGSAWLRALLPPIVIGPMIIIIGLSLAPVAIDSSGLGQRDDTYYSPRMTERITHASSDRVDETIYIFDGTDITRYQDGEVIDGVYDPGDIVAAYAMDSFSVETDFESIPTFLYRFDGETFHHVPSDGWKISVIALITFISVVLIAVAAKGFLRVIPFIVAMLIGYLASVLFGIIDLSAVFQGYRFFQVPEFQWIGTYPLNFSAVLIFLPLAFVTIAEHIGDHVVLGEIVDRDFLANPGLEHTLMGDGVATFVSAMLGGPANTTYGENTGVIAITRVSSVYVIVLAGLLAMVLGFLGYVQAFIASIPWAVIGGMTIVLYGLIAANGVKVLIKDRTDLSDIRNVIIISTMLVLGLGGAMIPLTGETTLTGMSLAMVAGVLLNQLIGKRNSHAVDNYS